MKPLVHRHKVTVSSEMSVKADRWTDKHKHKLAPKVTNSYIEIEQLADNGPDSMYMQQHDEWKLIFQISAEVSGSS